MKTPSLIGLDWGTSVLRAYLLGEGGAVLASRSENWGIMHVPGGDFPAAYDAMTLAWREKWPGLPALSSGMVGSAQGWRHAPYCPCPSGVNDLAQAMVQVSLSDNCLLHIVPGLLLSGAVPDVIRGEETQIFGAMMSVPELAEDALFILPGSHSKWAVVRREKIVDFKTYMTGELFAALCEHTILGRPAREADAGKSTSEAFERGVCAIRDGGARGLSALLFSTRSLVLTQQLDAGDSLEYLSGLLIGEEIRCALPAGAPHLALIGARALCERYQRALVLFGSPTPRLVEDTAAKGLWEIARISGLLGV
jgi:2-dehydro-3-deoxygalactonokinase